MALLSFDELKRELRVETSHDDENLQDLLDRSSAIVFNAMEIADDTYDDTDAPPIWKALCKEIARSLYENADVDPMTPAAKRLLSLLRDPALA